MVKINFVNLFSVLILTGVIFVFIAVQSVENDHKKIFGAIAEIGNGTVESYGEMDAEDTPVALGVLFTKDALENLPKQLTDGHRCADLDGDEKIDPDNECLPWHERVIPLPSEISRRDDIPFKWILLNWNPEGHIPEGVWNLPHFDIHFYIEDIENVFSLMPGPCGPERMRCDQYEIATKEVPSKYIHEDFEDVGAAAPAMGNHLIDPTGPEFDGEPFTRSWIFGAYDGQITFYEEMLSLDYMHSQPDDCFPIKTPPAVELTGYYPTIVCTRYHPEDSSVSVSMEEFEFREAE